MKTELGKIIQSDIHLDGRHDHVLCFQLLFRYGKNQHRIGTSIGFNDFNAVPKSKENKFSEKEREKSFLNMIKAISDALHASNKKRVSDLVDVPVELTLSGEGFDTTVHSWRILTESI